MDIGKRCCEAFRSIDLKKYANVDTNKPSGIILKMRKEMLDKSSLSIFKDKSWKAQKEIMLYDLGRLLDIYDLGLECPDGTADELNKCAIAVCTYIAYFISNKWSIDLIYVYLTPCHDLFKHDKYECRISDQIEDSYLRENARLLYDAINQMYSRLSGNEIIAHYGYERLYQYLEYQLPNIRFLIDLIAKDTLLKIREAVMENY